MSKEKIEEMAKAIAVARGYGCTEQDHCDMSCQTFKCGCIPHEDAQILYTAGYRKQSEGHWDYIATHDCFSCSICKFDSDVTMKYCGGCGALMKGDVQE